MIPISFWKGFIIKFKETVPLLTKEKDYNGFNLYIETNRT